MVWKAIVGYFACEKRRTLVLEKKKERESWAGEVMTVLTNAYAFIILLLFPLFYRDKLYDIFPAKRDFFFLAVIVFLTIAVILLLFVWMERHRNGDGKRLMPREGRVVCSFGLILLVSALFTVVVNPEKEAVFWGVDVTRVGAATLMAGAASALLIGGYLRWNAVLVWAFLLGSGGVFLLQVLNQWRIDPLGMFATMREEQIPLFTSTIGNINFNASYDSVVVPVGIALFVCCREKISKWVYGIFVFLGFSGMICCRSDSIFLTLFLVFFVLFEVVLRSGEGLAKCLDVVLLFLGSGSLIGTFYHLWSERAVPFLDGLANLFIDGRVIGAEIILFAVLLVVRWKGMDFFTEVRVKMVRRLFHGCLLVLLLLFAGAFFWAGARGEEAVRGTFFQYFVFSDAWGSRRGFIFKRSVGLYLDYPLSRKLFGCGPDNLPAVLNAAYGEEMQAFMGNLRFKDCHNEFLQILVSFGAVGTVGYFGMILSVLVLCIRRFPQKEAALAGILGLSAYLVQGLVNSPTIAVVPMLFLGLGVFCSALGVFDRSDPTRMKKYFEK